MLDREHTIRTFLHSKSEVVSKTPYTEADLKAAQDRVEEVQVAIDAIRLRRKVQPIGNISFDKIIKVSDLRIALSHPDDQDKQLWAFAQQGEVWQYVVGAVQSEYLGKPTINIVINVNKRSS